MRLRPRTEMRNSKSRADGIDRAGESAEQPDATTNRCANESQQSFTSEIDRNAQASYLLLFLQVAYPAVFAVLMTTTYGVGEYGQFAPLLAVTSGLAIIVDFGSMLFAPRWIGRCIRPKVRVRRVAAMLLWRMCIGTFATSFVLIFIKKLVPAVDPSVAGALVSMSVLAVVLSPQSFDYALQRLARFAVPSLIVRIAAAAAMAIFAATGYPSVFLVLIYLGSSLVVSLLTAHWEALHATIDRRLVRTLRTTARRSVAHGLASVAANLSLVIPHIVAGAMLNPVQTGALHLGGMLVRAACSVAEPLAASVYAALSRVGAQQAIIPSIAVQAKYRRIQITVACLASLGLMMVSGVLAVQTIFDIKNSFLVAEIVGIQTFLPLLVSISQIAMLELLLAQPGTHTHAKINATGACILAIACVAVAGTWGVRGLAAATVAFEIGMTFAYTLLANRVRMSNQ